MGYKYLPLTAECCASRMHFALPVHIKNVLHKQHNKRVIAPAPCSSQMIAINWDRLQLQMLVDNSP